MFKRRSAFWRRLLSMSSAIVLVSAGLAVAAPPPAAEAASCTGQLRVTVVDDRGVVQKAANVSLEPYHMGDIDGVQWVFRYLCTGKYVARAKVSYDSVTTKSWTGTVTNGKTTSVRIQVSRDGVINFRTKGASLTHSPTYVVKNAAGKIVSRVVTARKYRCHDDGDDFEQTFVNVAPGTYTITMVDTSKTKVVPIGATSRKLTLGPAQKATANFEIRAEGGINGRLSNRLYGRELIDSENSCLYGSVIATAGDGYQVQIPLASNGKYSFKGLPAGTYRLTFRAATAEFAPSAQARSQIYPGLGKKAKLVAVGQGKYVTVPTVRLPDTRRSIRFAMTVPQRTTQGQSVCWASLIAGSGKAYGAKVIGEQGNRSTQKWVFQGWVPKAGSYRVKLRCRYLESSKVLPQNAPVGAETPYYGAQLLNEAYPASTYYYDGTKDGTTSSARAKRVKAQVSPTRVSASVTVTRLAKAKVSKPVIKGTPRLGKVLKVAVPKNTSKRYYRVVWLRNGKAIMPDSGEGYISDTRHRVVKSDRGKKLTVRIRVYERYRLSVAKGSNAVRVPK